MTFSPLPRSSRSSRFYASLLRSLVALLLLSGGACAQPDNTLTTVAGNGTSGFIDTNTPPEMGLPATQTKLSQPSAVAMDGAGNLFIADEFNNVIRKLELQSGLLSVFAGTSKPGYGGDGGLASKAKFNRPSGVAVDSAGNVFIADTENHKVRRVDQKTGIVTTLAGTGASGYQGDGGPAAKADLSRPRGLVFDRADNLFIAVSDNQKVRRVDAKTGFISTVAGTGVPGHTGDGGPATQAQLALPVSLAFDGKGNLFIAELSSGMVRRVDAKTGLISTVAGQANFHGYEGDGGSALEAQLNGPYGVAVDGAGNLFIADSINNCIRRVDAKTGLISTVAGSTAAGGSDTKTDGDGGPATQAKLFRPQGIAFDGAGNLFIADKGNNRIRRVSGLAQSQSTRGRSNGPRLRRKP